MGALFNWTDFHRPVIFACHQTLARRGGIRRGRSVLGKVYPAKPGNVKKQPMSKERFAERKAELQNAVKRLQEAVAQPENDLVRDAVIQRFEFTFELTWKSLKLYLERQGLDCGGPRSTLKRAFVEGLIASPEQADVWLQLLEDRNLTAHAYDEALAARIYRHIVKDYAPVLGAMTEKIQTLDWD
jgi:nucleotidyltransferase substrate binding protein (TIGR01987 family)